MQSIICVDSKTPTHFNKTAYSENASLNVFLESLSCHKVGAKNFTESIALLSPQRNWDILDIGCGNGQFTDELLAALLQEQLSPASITAIDPDIDNLKCYKQRLEKFSNTLITTSQAGVENLPDGVWVIVMCSHSLYQFMENPSISDVSKNRVLKSLVHKIKQGGAILISMASVTSPAYEYKRKVLELAGMEDMSVFGEDIVRRLKDIDITFSMNCQDSYIDVTDIVCCDHNKLLDWTRYFCRLSLSQISLLDVEELRELMLSLAERFSELPTHLAQSYSLAPAACGSPKPHTFILPHKECFITVKPLIAKP
jgi:SAM-dependent methyltransferase